MKYINKITCINGRSFIFVLGMFLLSGCSDFLEEVPKSNITSSNYYNNEKDAEAAVTYAYQDLNAIYNLDYWLIGDIASDNFTLSTAGLGSGQSADFGLFSWSSSTSVVGSFWNSHFNAITNVNAALDKIQNIEGNEEFLAELMGELYFLRALYYYNLVRVYGDVPIILTLLTASDNLNVSRDNAADVYLQIIGDLNQAIEILPELPRELGRTSELVAKALLAKVYLTRASSPYVENSENDYAHVISLCDDIIGSGYFALVPNYLDIFKTTNELKNSESLFEVQFADNVSNLSSTIINQFLLSIDFTNPISVWQAQPSDDFVNNMEPGDIRALFVSDTTLTGFEMTDGRWLTKYQDVEEFGLDLNTGPNFYVLRYSEVLLMLAEAENEVNGPTAKAIAAVNSIRNRAGLSDLPNTSISQKNNLRDAILQERRIEFIGEGQRWFDLVRTGRLVMTMNNLGLTIDDRRNIFPIPLTEMDANSAMIQNEGY